MRRLVRVLPLAAVVSIAACGGDDGADGGNAGEQSAVARGAQLVDDNGCQSCHDNGVGPSWDGLHGSTVELDDGTTVDADEEYLARAISDPGADEVAGYSIAMPDNGLGDDEVADIVAYLMTLGDLPEATSP